MSLSVRAIVTPTLRRAASSQVKAARQPNNSSAVTDDATTTKLPATPTEVAFRSSIPTATVHNHTTTPVGTTAVGRRHA